MEADSFSLKLTLSVFAKDDKACQALLCICFAEPCFHVWLRLLAEPFLLFLSPYVLPPVSMRLSFQALAKWHSNEPSNHCTFPKV